MKTTTLKQNNKDKDDNLEINKAIDFMPNWKLEEKCFRGEMMSPVKSFDPKTNNTESIRKSWPRIKPVAQIVYENWFGKVVDPYTNKFYPQRDAQGSPVKQPDNGPNARYVVSTIIRIKRIDDKEYLYTLGGLRGFNSLGALQTCSSYRPEVWTLTHFDRQRKFDEKDDRIIEVSKGPISQEDVYTIPFSPENVDKLFAKTNQKNNPNFKLGKHHNKICTFLVKDEASGTAIEVAWSSVKDTLKLFKEKDFTYLYNGDYIPAPVKAELRARSEGITGEKQSTVPRLENNNTSNNNNNINSNAYG